MDPVEHLSLVPLDRRPFTCYTPIQIGRAGGLNVEAPDPILLGQYFHPADIEAVAEWWENAASHTQASVVAIPMLAYGGLIASRYHRGLTLEGALANLKVIRRIKRKYPQHKIYAFDSIMRLATSPARDYPGNFSGKIMLWSILKDKVEMLGMQELQAEYEELTRSIPRALLQDYMDARKRNFAINQAMIEMVRNGFIDYLIIGQDDAQPYGMHRSERNTLMEQIDLLRLNDKIQIFPGADVVASLLVAKLVTESIDKVPRLYVEYSRKQGMEWIAPYQDIEYNRVIHKYAEVTGGEMTECLEESDIILMANTAGTEELTNFAKRIKRYMEDGRFVAVGDDAIAGVSDPALIDALKKHIRFSSLAGYSGWNVGVPIAQAIVRWALQHASHKPAMQTLKRAAESHLELLLEALVHEESYRSHVRGKMISYAKSVGDDPQHLQTHYQTINELAANAVRPLGEAWYAEHFAGSTMVMNQLEGDSLRETVKQLEGWTLQLPWNRTAEMETFPKITVEIE